MCSAYRSVLSPCKFPGKRSSSHPSITSAPRRRGRSRRSELCKRNAQFQKTISPPKKNVGVLISSYKMCPPQSGVVCPPHPALSPFITLHLSPSIGCYVRLLRPCVPSICRMDCCVRLLLPHLLSFHLFPGLWPGLLGRSLLPAQVFTSASVACLCICFLCLLRCRFRLFGVVSYSYSRRTRAR